MKIGLYFGTFNPVHAGHMIIANHMAEYTDMDEVWMVVTPHNPHKKKATLLDDHHRLEMVHLATKPFDRIKPCDIEFKLPQPNYTVHTLAHLQDKFPQHTFALIMGEDNLNTLHKWKNYEVILQHHPIYVYPRMSSPKTPDELIHAAGIHHINAPVVEISSTFIRNAIKAGKNVTPLLPDPVWKYIQHNLFYLKQV